VQIARHPKRPYALDYVQAVFTDFVELHGDRTYADDKALITGLAKLDGQPFFVMAHQKGRDAKENIMRNFGARTRRLPESASHHAHWPKNSMFRSVCSLIRRAPIRHRRRRARASLQHRVIIRDMARYPRADHCIRDRRRRIRGALGIGIGDRVIVLENAYYSVISPEAARPFSEGPVEIPRRSRALKLTAKDLMELKLIDDVVKEPLGGAHRDRPRRPNP